MRQLFVFAFMGMLPSCPWLLRSQETQPAGNLEWHDVREIGVEGQGWMLADLEAPYDRLPVKAKRVVRDAVWNLSRHSAGQSFRFNTDATDFSIRYELGSSRLAMPHMPATGVSGVDLYALGADGKWKWVDVSRPESGEVTLRVRGVDQGNRSYMAYLPLYNSVVKMEIGVPEGSKFEAVPARQAKPMVFYGTSITHGACASRPGMTHVAILGRKMDMPVVNLGFSGNGKMELEVAALLAEINAAVYVIDCLPNMVEKEVAERAEPFVRLLRRARPSTPIVLVEDRTYGDAWIRKTKRTRHEGSRTSLVRAYDNLVSSGVKNVHYLPGENLLGDDHEGTTDGSHPNDLGFMRQAAVFESLLKKVIIAKN